MKALEPFEGLSLEGRSALARGLSKHEFAKGDCVVSMGQSVSGAYVVLQGELRVYAMSPEGQQTTLYLLRPGDACVLAINCLFNDLLYPAWVDAQADSVVAVVPGALYRSMFERERTIQNLTVRALSTAVFRLMSELHDVHCSRLDQRLANFLVNRASSHGVVEKTQQEIAAYIGASREAVAKAMAEFSGKGWIATARGRVTLLAPENLTMIASRRATK